MTEYLTTDTDLKKVADAIRATTGGTAPLSFPDGFVSAIAGGQETTSLNVQIQIGTADAIFGICWQASNDWMFSTQFDTSTNFILLNVLIGGYVIFFIDPTKVASLTCDNTSGGAEIFEPVGFDSQIDTSRVCVVLKITSANPTVIVGVYDN